MAGRRLQRVLIANRGEIAVRVARACRELGIESVAVFSDADRGAMHVRAADRAVHIGPAPAKQSYLDQAAVLRAARESGCDAIHPGYGFLSQNGDFADAVAAAGLVFVGPPASAMRLMGDKTASRVAMSKAGVPVVPGFEGNGREDAAALRKAAAQVGFPLLVKAAAGGGGRGMRVVHSAAEIDDALASARREAENAFGDGRLFLERFVAKARHVEIQVLADMHSHCVHLLERECSIQRRYQKILEESPSPRLDAALRARMGEAAVKAGAACGYVGAGTVEFLVGDGGEFFFLEMNTRIQVEHPVTELVTGVDLVGWQLRVAAGEPLGFAQSDVGGRGHAIECRVNAEDPGAGFAPSSGSLALAHFPSGPGIRVDAGFETGDAISLHYDSLVAKLLVHAEDRDAAIRRMRAALAETAIFGVATNLEFLRDLLREPHLVRGETTTTFVADHMADWKPREVQCDEARIALAVADHLSIATEGGGRADRPEASPWTVADGFRLGGGA